MENTTKQAVIYCRIASKAQEDTLSLAKQISLCKEIAKKHDYEVAHVFCESASGFSPALRRKEFNSMMQYLDRFDINTVIVQSFDRISKDLQVIEAFEKLEHKQKIWFIDESGSTLANKLSLTNNFI